jgi:16S rRNA (cytosine967-C5)-methyltransferase
LPALQALEAARVEHAGALVSGPFMRLWPHVHQTDGFFAAIWQKR